MHASVRRIVLVTAAMALSLTACEQIRESAGVSKKAPDEFRVVRNAPLSVPPNYDLRPPQPGARPVPQIDPRREAQQATLGRDTAAASRPVADSAGEEALLRALQVNETPEDIRTTVDEESAIMAADSRGFVERLMFWREEPPPGTVVDPTGESRRIQENAALGRPPQSGTTPTIERKSKDGFSIF